MALLAVRRRRCHAAWSLASFLDLDALSPLSNSSKNRYHRRYRSNQCRTWSCGERSRSASPGRHEGIVDATHHDQPPLVTRSRVAPGTTRPSWILMPSIRSAHSSKTRLQHRYRRNLCCTSCCGESARHDCNCTAMLGLPNRLIHTARLRNHNTTATAPNAICMTANAQAIDTAAMCAHWGTPYIYTHPANLGLDQ